MMRSLSGPSKIAIVVFVLLSGPSLLRAQDDAAESADEVADEAAPAEVAPEGAGNSAQMRDMNIDDEGARSHFRVGQSLYREGRFADAAREFEEAHLLSQRPTLLYNAYLAWRDAGQVSDSARVLRTYLDANPEAEDAAVLRDRLVAMEAQVQQQREQTEAEEAERARLEEESAQLAREAEEQRSRAEQAEEGRSPVPWIIGGVGAALVVAAVAPALVAKDRADTLETLCMNDDCANGLRDTRDEGRRAAILADVFWGVGTAALITSVVMFVVRGGDNEETTAPPAEAGAACTSDGCMATAQVRF